MVDSQSEKIPWRKAELAANRVVKSVEVDLERLQQLKRNILEYETQGDRRSAKNEVVKAHKAIEHVQESLDSLQALRDRTQTCDLEKCDKRLASVRQWVKDEIEKFHVVDADLMEYLEHDLAALLKSVEEDKDQIPSQPQLHAEKLTIDLQVVQEDEKRIAEIAQDVQDVKEVMGQLNSLVMEQKAAVDSIEDNVEQAHENVKASGFSLSKAATLKTASFAVVGALCGALVGGPVGLVAGAKIGAVAAGTGIAVGAVAGRKLQKVKDEQNEVELQNLQAAADMANTRSLRQDSVNHGNRLRPADQADDLVQFD